MRFNQLVIAKPRTPHLKYWETVYFLCFLHFRRNCNQNNLDDNDVFYNYWRLYAFVVETLSSILDKVNWDGLQCKYGILKYDTCLKRNRKTAALSDNLRRDAFMSVSLAIFIAEWSGLGNFEAFICHMTTWSELKERKYNALNARVLYYGA